MSSKAKFEPHRGSPYLVQAAPGFLESVPDPHTPESLYEEHETILKSELGRILGMLPASEAEAIAKWLSGMTQAQIAEQDGVTQAAISIRAKRGLEKLFEMRDTGKLGTLKFIWDGLHKIQSRINAEIAMERASDSGVSLPLGHELGDDLGAKVVWAMCPADVGDGFDDPEPETKSQSKRRRVMNTPAKRSKLKCAVLNGKETAVLEAVVSGGETVHISRIEKLAHLSNLEVRNSLRKLVRTSMVSKLGRGLYRWVS